MNNYVRSIDVTSLFTNTPLTETVRVYHDTLYSNPDINEPILTESLLEKQLLKATTEAGFSCDGVRYRQIEGVVIGSPLGPVLDNIIIGY